MNTYDNPQAATTEPQPTAAYATPAEQAGGNDPRELILVLFLAMAIGSYLGAAAAYFLVGPRVLTDPTTSTGPKMTMVQSLETLGLLILGVALTVGAVLPTVTNTPGWRSRARSASLAWAQWCARRAAWIAGKRRAYLRETWPAELAAPRRNGRPVSGWRALMYGPEFLAAALRFRLRDVAESGMRLVDKILKSRARTRATRNVLLIVVAFRIYSDAGFDGLIADVVAFPVLWHLFNRAAEWLRKYRGVEIEDEPTPRPKKPQGPANPG